MTSANSFFASTHQYTLITLAIAKVAKTPSNPQISLYTLARATTKIKQNETIISPSSARCAPCIYMIPPYWMRIIVQHVPGRGQHPKDDELPVLLNGAHQDNCDAEHRRADGQQSDSATG